MARSKKRYLSVAQIRVDHLEPEVLEELRRRSTEHNTSITEEIVRVVTGSIGGPAVAVRRQAARHCKNCDNTGFDATEPDGFCHVINCPKEEVRRVRVLAPFSPPSE